LISPEERDGSWDPMDVDDEDEVFGKGGGPESMSGANDVVVVVDDGDPMDLD
jgi:hypothetical protein